MKDRTFLINTVISKDQEIEGLKKETNFVYRCNECGNEIGDEYAYLYDGTIKCKECEEEDDDEQLLLLFLNYCWFF